MADHKLLTDLIHPHDIVMLTTAGSGGSGPAARPLTALEVADGVVSFLVGDHAEWLGQLDGTCGLTLSDDKSWVSMTGRCSTTADPAVIEDLGNPISDAWFQDGQHPLALRFEVADGSWWSAPTAIAMAIDLVRAKVTDTEPRAGDHGDIGTHG